MKRRYYIFLVLTAVLIGLSLYFMTRNLKKSYDASKFYSSELTMTYSREGNIETCAWVNDAGDITWAEDKKYAYEIKTYNDDNQLIREDFYDEKGNPAYLQTGYCTVAIKEDWPVITYKYFDENNCFIERTDKYSILVKTFESKDTKDYTDRYYDEEMNPVSVYGRYGVRYYYDGDRQIGYTYLAEKDSPIDISSGYATVTRTFYDDNMVKTEMYIDTKGEAVCISDGHYGISIEYYANGNRSIVTSIDVNAKPMKNKQGYVSLQYIYRENGTLEKELYLDAVGEPCKANDGSYGKYHSGEITYYLSKSGIKYMPINDMLNQYPYLVVVAALVICILFIVLSKKGRIGLLVLYTLFILFKTIFSRETRALDLILNPFDSYRNLFFNVGSTLQIIDNIWLFIPYGMGVKSIVNNKKLLVILFSMPLLVELIQLVFRVGTFETADIINNVLGELIGLGLFVLYIKYTKNMRKV